MKTNDLTKVALNSIVNHAIDKMSDYSRAGIYGCDLHNDLFNQDYFIVYHSRAIQWLKECDIDTFDAIDEVFQYEKDNFGEVNTEVNPEAIVNMYAYIAGEAILSEIDTLQNRWNENLTEKDCKKIIKELKALIK